MTDIRVIHPIDRDVLEVDATSGMVREAAVANDEVWVGLVRAAPRRPSGWHHHGDYDSYIYVIEGEVSMEFGPEGSKVIQAGPGDFIHVPKQLVHREVNSSDYEGSIILTRVGSGPPVINVEGPDAPV